MAPLASHPIFMLSGVNKLSCRFHLVSFTLNMLLVSRGIDWIKQQSINPTVNVDVSTIFDFILKTTIQY